MLSTAWALSFSGLAFFSDASFAEHHVAPTNLDDVIGTVLQALETDINETQAEMECKEMPAVLASRTA